MGQDCDNSLKLSRTSQGLNLPRGGNLTITSQCERLSCQAKGEGRSFNGKDVSVGNMAAGDLSNDEACANNGVGSLNREMRMCKQQSHLVFLHLSATSRANVRIVLKSTEDRKQLPWNYFSSCYIGR
jgi:hypothetical protein